MKSNDFAYINQVADYFLSTIDEQHPKGNLSAVAQKFSINRTKVNKILITAGVIDSPLHQDIMKLKEQGYETGDIAKALGVSEATVKINLPYEKVIYNAEEKSTGAMYTEKFRKREKVFLDDVVRKPTNLEVEREAYIAQRGINKEELAAENAKWFSDLQDDTLHLMPAYTGEEGKLFKIRPDVGLIHVELNEDYSEYRDLVGLKYGNTISRDILVPLDLPLHNLHYALNQAFGFTNSHLHDFKLTEKDLNWVTDGKVANWKKLIGIVFKNPVRDEDLDFWDDDYEGGSPKKWMRSKYTGPYYTRVYEESYPYIREDIKTRLRNLPKTFRELTRRFDADPFQLNEVQPLWDILQFFPDEQMSYPEFCQDLDEAIADAGEYPPRSYQSQPIIGGFASSLCYTYDFGDNWEFTITPMPDVEYLLRDKRVTLPQVREAIRKVCILARPVLLAYDGKNLKEDVGGVTGYVDFLEALRDGGEEGKEYQDWAEGTGWDPVVTENSI